MIIQIDFLYINMDQVTYIEQWVAESGEKRARIHFGSEDWTLTLGAKQTTGLLNYLEDKADNVYRIV